MTMTEMMLTLRRSYGVEVVFYTKNSRGVLYEKLFLKILQYLQETLVLESLFKKVAGLKACNFKRHQHRYFPVNIAKFSRLPVLKNIFEWLFFLLFQCLTAA